MPLSKSASPASGKVRLSLKTLLAPALPFYSLLLSPCPPSTLIRRLAQLLREKYPPAHTTQGRASSLSAPQAALPLTPPSTPAAFDGSVAPCSPLTQLPRTARAADAARPPLYGGSRAPQGRAAVGVPVPAAAPTQAHAAHEVDRGGGGLEGEGEKRGTVRGMDPCEEPAMQHGGTQEGAETASSTVRARGGGSSSSSSSSSSNLHDAPGPRGAQGDGMHSKGSSGGGNPSGGVRGARAAGSSPRAYRPMEQAMEHARALARRALLLLQPLILEVRCALCGRVAAAAVPASAHRSTVSLPLQSTLQCRSRA